MKHRAWRLITLAALCAVALLTAHAAILPLHSARLGTFSYAHPCPATATASPTGTGASSTGVSLTLSSSRCAGMTVDVTVRDAHGAVITQGQGQVVGAAASIGVSAYTPQTGYAVTVSARGWLVPTSWVFTPPGPVYQTTPDTVLTSLTWTLVTNNPVQACFDVDVSTTSITPVAWSMTADLTKAPFNGVDSSKFVFGGTDGWRYQTGPISGKPGLMLINGAPGGGRTTVVAGQALHVQVCNYKLPDAVQTPGSYTTSVTQGTWSGTQACLNVTVRGNGSEQFYFAWTAQLDMGPAVARLKAAGRALSAYTYGDTEWMVTRAAAPDLGPNAFRVISKGPAAIAGSGTSTFTTCANSY